MLATRHDLVEEHLGLARGLAARYRHRGIPTEDLEQIAYLGLVKAADRFRDDSGHDFGAYATPTITGRSAATSATTGGPCARPVVCRNCARDSCTRTRPV